MSNRLPIFSGGCRAERGYAQDGSDYEIGIGDPSWSTLQGLAKQALQAPGAFDFSEFLL